MSNSISVTLGLLTRTVRRTFHIVVAADALCLAGSLSPDLVQPFHDQAHQLLKGISGRLSAAPLRSMIPDVWDGSFLREYLSMRSNTSPHWDYVQWATDRASVESLDFSKYLQQVTSLENLHQLFDAEVMASLEDVHRSLQQLAEAI